MKQRQKNIRLLVLLAILIVATVILYSWEPESSKTTVEKDLFSVTDTAEVDRIVITGENQRILLERSGNTWTVNDKYPLDEGLRKVLLSVINRVQVQRPVSEIRQDDIIGLLRKKGNLVEIFSANQPVEEYIAGGSMDQNTSYFMDPDQKIPYQVHLPGYESYVAGIFEISENDWRDRILFSSSLNSITRIELEYPDSAAGFTILNQQELQIPGLETLDTAALYTYLDQFSYILADRYLEQSEVPDSVQNQQPFLKLDVYRIGYREPFSIEFYQGGQDTTRIYGRTGTQWVEFQRRRIESLFRTRQNFRKSDS